MWDLRLGDERLMIGTKKYAGNVIRMCWEAADPHERTMVVLPYNFWDAAWTVRCACTTEPQFEMGEMWKGASAKRVRVMGR